MQNARGRHRRWRALTCACWASFAVFAGVSLTFVAHAATYVVSSQSAFESRAATLMPGDQLIVADGRYDGWRMRIDASGTEAAPIIVRARTDHGVTFTGSSSLDLNGSHIIARGFDFERVAETPTVQLAGGGHNRLTECRFFANGNGVNVSRHIVRARTGHNRVDHCRFEGSRAMSLGNGGVPQHNRFDHNHFVDIPDKTVIAGEREAIQLGQNSSHHPQSAHTIVEHNVFDRADGDGEIISSKSSDNIFRYNTFTRCAGSLVLRGGNRAQVYGNVFIESQGGVRLYGLDHVIVNNLFVNIERWAIRITGGSDSSTHARVERALVAHNTIVDAGENAILVRNFTSGMTDLPRDLRLINNLVTGRSGQLFQITQPGDHEIRRNLLWATGSAKVGQAGDEAVLRDPQLVGAGETLALTADSPAIDRAIALAEVSVDRHGQARPQGDGPDIGADEHSPGAPEPRPDAGVIAEPEAGTPPEPDAGMMPKPDGDSSPKPDAGPSPGPDAGGQPDPDAGNVTVRVQGCALAGTAGAPLGTVLGLFLIGWVMRRLGCFNSRGRHEMHPYRKVNCETRIGRSSLHSATIIALYAVLIVVGFTGCDPRRTPPQDAATDIVGDIPLSYFSDRAFTGDLPVQCVPEAQGFVRSVDPFVTCCTGLVKKINYTNFKVNCEPPAQGGAEVDFLCLACGDGRCGTGESFCNCPSDCIVAPCLKEGEAWYDVFGPLGYRCCPGLSFLESRTPQPGGECAVSPSIYHCTACGDGHCSEIENRCSCPEDC